MKKTIKCAACGRLVRPRKKDGKPTYHHGPRNRTWCVGSPGYKPRREVVSAPVILASELE